MHWRTGRVGVLLTFINVVVYGQGGAAYEQDSMPDGVVCFEAEQFHSNVAVGVRQWVMVTNGTYSGGRGMQCIPNTNGNQNANYVTQSPRLDFRVNFNRTGIHAISIRGVGLTGNDDTCHAGLDGQALSTCDRIFGFSATPGWSFSTLDAGQPVALFNVPSVGIHTVNIWMREDGFIVDKIVVSSNTNFLPAGLGPPVSPRVGESASASENAQETWITGVRWSNGVMVADFEPVPGIESYVPRGGATLLGGPGEDGSVSAQGFSLVIPPGAESKLVGVGAAPISSNRELTSIVLNRLAYGPTPDELDRVLTGPTPIGPESYIAEQMQPEGLTETANAHTGIVSAINKIESGQGYLSDLQALQALRAVLARRQLLETLLQFWDNHFNTYYWKTTWVLSDWGLSWDETQRVSAQFEHAEREKWRQVLLNPNGTFYDLLKISAESPAMLIYLDTVDNVASAPNENYAREIQELFCMGVDNGYDQSDIERMAPAWTGWKVARVLPGDAGNPHAPVNTNGLVVLPRRDMNWRYRKGTNEPPASWKNPEFVPGGDWFTGQASIGYGSTNNTVLADMSNGYFTVYLRKTFVVTNLSQMSAAKLRLFIDDGCVAYLNGQEVHRFNAPANPVLFSNRATTTVGKASWRDAPLTNPASWFVAGTNVLALHVLNRTINNNDLDADAEVVISPVWSFVFNPADHNPTNKTIFAGKRVNPRFGAPWALQPYTLSLPARGGTNGILDGYDIVAHLANLPYTMEFISVKLCRLFVHEDFQIGGYYNVASLTPEQQLIRACMTAWDTPGPDGRKGNIRSILNVIFQSDLFRHQKAAQQKVKTPFEFTVSAVRALRADLGGGLFTASTDGYDLSDPMWYAGMELFGRDFPDGWSEIGRNWIDTGALNERFRFVENLLMPAGDALKTVDYGSSGADNHCDPVSLLTAKLPGSSWTDATAVANFFLALLFPGEGKANLDLERAAAVDYLNSGDDGIPGASPFSALSVGAVEYQKRVRGLVALFMSGPKFQEQ